MEKGTTAKQDTIKSTNNLINSFKRQLTAQEEDFNDILNHNLDIMSIVVVVTMIISEIIRDGYNRSCDYGKCYLIEDNWSIYKMTLGFIIQFVLPKSICYYCYLFIGTIIKQQAFLPLLLVVSSVQVLKSERMWSLIVMCSRKLSSGKLETSMNDDDERKRE